MEEKKTRGSSLGLSTFEVVGKALRELSLTRTARELGVSQPTVSFHVDRFENHFGYPILRRVGNMLQRTDAGDRAMEICRTIGELVEELDGLRADMPASFALPPALLDLWLARHAQPAFSRRYVMVADAVTNQRQRFFRKELAAVAWYVRPGEQLPEHSIPVELTWVGMPAAAAQNQLTLARFPRNSMIEEALTEHVREPLRHAQVRLESSDLSLIRAFILRGEGVAYMPAAYARRHELPIIENDTLKPFTAQLGVDHWPEMMAWRDFEIFVNELRAMLG